MLQYEFKTDPVADGEAIIAGANYRFTVINDVVIRYEWAEDGVFEDRASTFAINRRFPRRHKPLIRDTESRLEIMTPTIHVTYDKKRFSPNGLVIEAIHETTLWETTWRYGETPGSNLGGTARTLDGVDGRCDMGSGVLSRVGFSVIDDSDSMLFDGAGFVAPRRPGDRVDGYLFSFGSDFQGAMRAFFAISGHTPRLPRWSLGNWWSRYHKYTAESYLALMDRFRDRGIPLSVAVLDMDWHLVGADEVPHSGWTGYSWDKKLFPDPEAFTAALHERGLKITLNDHPHLGVGSYEEQYEAMAKHMGHDTSQGKTPILFDPADPRFMHGFFNILHRGLEDKGCDFWWMDWQQGPHSKVPGLDPLWLLNHFQFLDQKQQAGEHRALNFSRYAGPGSHRYPVGFSGDALVTWDSLRFQPEFTATAANVGFGWWSHDVGGHMFGARDDELFARWVQLGVFSPVLRLHSADTPWGSKEPWLYGPEAERAAASSMRFRHRLVPYLHTLNWRFATLDEPLVEPLYWKFPTRQEAFGYPNQYFFGPSLVVAPVVDPTDRQTRHAPVKVWLPPVAARYVDIFTGTVYDGDRELRMWRPLGQVPALAPEGSVIPLDGHRKPANGCKNPSSLELLVVVGRDGKFEMVEDSADDAGFEPGGDGSVERTTTVEWNQAEGRLTIDKAAGRDWIVRFLGVETVGAKETSINKVHGVNNDAGADVESADDELAPGQVVKVNKEEVGGDGTLTLHLSAPRLHRIDHTDKFRALLLDFQIEFALKDKLFGILNSSKPTGVKMGELLGVGCAESIKGPLVELLLADSRTA
ncbi:Alpha-xylosidase [Colletotrichum tanaceti]|uniref:Alpha-xylosidase n=1 Tax=Colletotrichum tanaceti TaxID=1306861 RepID=A0A4U6XE65_9PEZI|nr:Alpha-xylosidase [Colletotrichum tanaceti]